MPESASPFKQLITELTPRYGAGEARSLVRILFEDAFHTRDGANHVLTPEEAIRFEQIRIRLLAGEPLQYVLGEADFFGLKLHVTPAVLIPRQETEELVVWVLSWLKETSIRDPWVLDIGIGSGCIGIALKARRRDIELWGLEKSPEALDVARANAGRILNGQEFTFLQGDILEEAIWDDLPDFDIIVSNPPYIPRSETELLPEHVLQHEPEMALFVEGGDALLFYRAIATFAGKKLRPGGALFLECNEFNAEEVTGLLKESGFAKVQLRKDIAGADRMVFAGK